MLQVAPSYLTNFMVFLWCSYPHSLHPMIGWSNSSKHWTDYIHIKSLYPSNIFQQPYSDLFLELRSWPFCPRLNADLLRGNNTTVTNVLHVWHRNSFQNWRIQSKHINKFEFFGTPVSEGQCHLHTKICVEAREPNLGVLPELAFFGPLQTPSDGKQPQPIVDFFSL